MTATPQSTAHQTCVGLTVPSLSTLTCDDLRDEAAEADAQRDAAALPGRQRLAPAGRSAASLQHVLRARVLVEQREAVGERVLLRAGRELVDEALDHEGAARHAHAAPERGGDARRLLRDPVDVDVAES